LIHSIGLSQAIAGLDIHYLYSIHCKTASIASA
jgi:hypothetical protein